MAEAGVTAPVDLSGDLDRIEAAVRGRGHGPASPRVLADRGEGEARQDPRGPLRRPDRPDRHGGVPAGCETAVSRLGRQCAAARRRRSSGWRRRSPRRYVSSSHPGGAAAGRAPAPCGRCRCTARRTGSVGRLVGIRFTDYFIGGPPPPRPGLKTDYATYLARRSRQPRVDARLGRDRDEGRAVLRAGCSGPRSGAPWWSAAGLLAIGVVPIAHGLAVLA